MSRSSAYDQNLPSYSNKEFQHLKAAIDSKKAQSTGRINTRVSLLIWFNMKSDAPAQRQEGRQELSGT